MFLAEIPSLGEPDKFCFILFPIYILFFSSILFLLFWFTEFFFFFLTIYTNFTFREREQHSIFFFFPHGLYTYLHIPNRFLLTEIVKQHITRDA